MLQHAPVASWHKSCTRVCPRARDRRRLIISQTIVTALNLIKNIIVSLLTYYVFVLSECAWVIFVAINQMKKCIFFNFYIVLILI